MPFRILLYLRHDTFPALKAGNQKGRNLVAVGKTIRIKKGLHMVSQTYNPKTGLWVKRNKDNGQFMDNKMDGTPFKGVRKEHP